MRDAAMSAISIEGARVLVVGMARSGTAAVELLVEKGAHVRATDDKAKAPPRLAELGVEFAPQSPAVFEGVDLIVISPGVPADLPELETAQRRGASVIGELELASYYLQGKTIGITGSNGKTTTTAMAGHILREAGIPAQVGGNIGTPPAAMVRSSRPGQWNVLELSSFQLETIGRFRAEIGVALNVTPDHLDRHHSFEAYAAAKARLFETQSPGDFAVLNADDATCVSYAALTTGTAVWFSLARPVAPGAWLDENRILFDGLEFLDASEIPLRGRHNVENTMAASAAAHLAGASLGAIASAVKTFPGVEHRLEFVREIGGVEYYNDSKATNVDATLKAIQAFPGRLWIILGGKDKGSDYAPLRDPLRQKALAALLIGAAAGKIESQIRGAAPAIRCGTLPAALDIARWRAQAGDTVLLAPACASFDQFDNYEHRGRVFKQLVQEIARGGGWHNG
ncbi:MAG: UDP-N-acetylmuramoyl-L-alanine--D-glutamate ligase [Bryobacteraceae bacterium]